MKQDRPLPPLTALRAFEAAARLGSFTKAAGELAMTQAAVSYQVKQLERQLGVTLFRRAGRYVELTATGQRLANAASEAFALLRAACTNAAGHKHMRVWITALPTVASNWLVPRLGDFSARYPQYAVQLDSSVEALDLRTSEFDVAIRTGRGDWPGCDATPLFPNTFTAVCAPETIASLGVAAPCDLLKLPLFGRRDWWLDWFTQAGVSAADCEDLRSSDLGTQSSEVTAALAQGGAAIVTPAFFAQDFAAGRTCAPFPITVLRESSYWLVSRSGVAPLPNIRDFTRWVVEQAKQAPSLAI